MFQLVATAIDPTLPAGQATGITDAIVARLPILLALLAPYLTHAIQVYHQRVPAALQPIISAVGGVLIAVLAGQATNNPLSNEVLGIIGGISGLGAHALVQSPAIAPPLDPTTAGGPVPPVNQASK